MGRMTQAFRKLDASAAGSRGRAGRLTPDEDR
jgi:hypothetical protein